MKKEEILALFEQFEQAAITKEHVDNNALEYLEKSQTVITNGITLPFTYVGKGRLNNPRQSQNEERKRTFIFNIQMENELPDYLQYDFGLTN